VFLPDLIGQDGIDRVSDIAVADLTDKLTANSYTNPEWIRTGALRGHVKTSGWPLTSAGPHGDNFEGFEWLPTELVLHFDPYVVASYAEGPQQVRIPLAALQDVLRPDPRAPLPSFDCVKAVSTAEIAICSDQRLAQLDRRVAEAYAARLRYESLSRQSPRLTAQQSNGLPNATPSAPTRQTRPWSPGSRASTPAA
jgi:hypothetical protein